MTFSAGSYYVSSGPSSVGSQLALNVTSQLLLVLMLPNSGSDGILTNPSLGLEVFASVPGTFPSDAMPVVPPPLADLSPYGPGGTYFGLFGFDEGQLVQVRSEITSWVMVPEPPPAAVIVAALAGLLCSSRFSARS
jgi:hypothetical protein